MTNVFMPVSIVPILVVIFTLDGVSSNIIIIFHIARPMVWGQQLIKFLKLVGH